MIENTKHGPDCKMAFGRKDPNCARCRELMAGAEPRRWRGADRRANERRLILEIREHFGSVKHRTGGCGTVCTFGEW
jgi:hypothetical protein